MLNRLNHAVNNVRSNLLQLDSQPVGKAALTVVILLDVFIIISIFNGLDKHTRQLTSPDEYIPQHCRDVAVSRKWNEANRTESIAYHVNQYRERPTRLEPRPLQHAICEEITARFEEVETDRDLADALNATTSLKAEISHLNASLDNMRGAYEIRLLETIAEIEHDDVTATLQRQIAATANNLDALVARQEAIQATFAGNEKLQRLFTHLEALSADDRETLAQAYRDLNFWYPAKRLGMEMLFLIPLVLIFYLWNTRSITRQKPFQTLVSSHLLVVVFVPVLFKICELLYDIIPEKLLEHIIRFLETIGLVAIWHYLVIAAGIAAAMLLIYLLQKKLFSRDKEIAKRISKGRCQDCGVQLAPGSNACPQCGFEQFHECGHCHEMTFVFGRYCQVCGEQQ